MKSCIVLIQIIALAVLLPIGSAFARNPYVPPIGPEDYLPVQNELQIFSDGKSCLNLSNEAKQKVEACKIQMKTMGCDADPASPLKRNCIEEALHPQTELEEWAAMRWACIKGFYGMTIGGVVDVFSSAWSDAELKARYYSYEVRSACVKREQKQNPTGDDLSVVRACKNRLLEEFPDLAKSYSEKLDQTSYDQVRLAVHTRLHEIQSRQPSLLKFISEHPENPMGALGTAAIQQLNAWGLKARCYNAEAAQKFQCASMVAVISGVASGRKLVDKLRGIGSSGKTALAVASDEPSVIPRSQPNASSVTSNRTALDNNVGSAQAGSSSIPGPAASSSQVNDIQDAALAIRDGSRSNRIVTGSDEQKRILAFSEKLTDQQRIDIATALHGQALTPAQQQALLAAHELPLSDITGKARILKKAGFSDQEIQALMRTGITGKEFPEMSGINSEDTVRAINGAKGIEDIRAISRNIPRDPARTEEALNSARAILGDGHFSPVEEAAIVDAHYLPGQALDAKYALLSNKTNFFGRDIQKLMSSEAANSVRSLGNASAEEIATGLDKIRTLNEKGKLAATEPLIREILALGEAHGDSSALNSLLHRLAAGSDSLKLGGPIIKKILEESGIDPSTSKIDFIRKKLYLSPEERGAAEWSAGKPKTDSGTGQQVSGGPSQVGQVNEERLSNIAKKDTLTAEDIGFLRQGVGSGQISPGMIDVLANRNTPRELRAAIRQTILSGDDSKVRSALQRSIGDQWPTDPSKMDDYVKKLLEVPGRDAMDDMLYAMYTKHQGVVPGHEVIPSDNIGARKVILNGWRRQASPLTPHQIAELTRIEESNELLLRSKELAAAQAYIGRLDKVKSMKGAELAREVGSASELMSRLQYSNTPVPRQVVESWRETMKEVMRTIKERYPEGADVKQRDAFYQEMYKFSNFLLNYGK